MEKPKFGDICFASNLRTPAIYIGDNLCLWVSAMCNDLMISKFGMLYPNPPNGIVIPSEEAARAAATGISYAKRHLRETF